MKDIRVTIDTAHDTLLPPGRFDAARVDATTDDDIEQQARSDDHEAMKDMGFYVRRIRARLGMSQREFARRIGISVETLRNWEQGRRYPAGTAKALLRILDRAPETALAVLRD